MDSSCLGTLGHFREQIGGMLQDASGDLAGVPVLLEPVAGGPRWRYSTVGTAGGGNEAPTSLVIRGAGLQRPEVLEDYPTIDACLEQVRRSRAVGDRCAAVEWAQRLAVLLMADAGGDPLWSPRHG